jgi:pyruvate/2-oxoglutarate dehydrogenase complex dihydrolipoamide dehydrogenase (E3) component
VKVVVVGGGPAGIAAAVRARRLGAETTLLERDQLGGALYHQGPVPMRTLARTARLMRDARTWGAFGMLGRAPRVDTCAALANARRASRHLHDVNHMVQRLKAEGVEVAESIGPVRFVDPHTLAVADGRLVEADRIILATGGHDRRPPLPGLEHALTVHDVLHLSALPRRIAVVGGGAVGCQLASIFGDFGAQVSLIESGARLLVHWDADLGVALRRSFAERALDVRTGARIVRVDRRDAELDLHLTRGPREEVLTVDAVLLAVGWPGNLDSLALDSAGVETVGGYIRVDKSLRTNQPHIFAVGDVNGMKKIMQAAAHQGQVAADNAVLAEDRVYQIGEVPRVAFTDPEIASIGLTEAEARATYDCRVVRHDLRQLSRAVVDGRADGFCKLIAERKTGQLLGAQIIGDQAAEVIQLVAACMAGNLTVQRIADLQLAYPTFTQAVGLAALRLARQLDLLPRTSALDSAELSDLSGADAG